MLEITAPRRLAFRQSQKLRQHYWHIASSVTAVLSRSTSVQLPARFAPSLHYTQLQQSLHYSRIGKDVLRVCEQVVGKVVINFVQTSELYKLVMRRFEYIANYVFSVRSLLAAFNQVIVVCTHTQTAIFKVFNSIFYTLPTGPTNTNNLIKGNL